MSRIPMIKPTSIRPSKGPRQRQPRPCSPLAGLALALTGLVLLQGSAGAAATEEALPDLGIKDLMNIEVTSVSKRAQKLSETAASVYVITSEDIRRSGARNVPEALRLAPGVDVAAMGGGRYAVTIRGDNSRFSNKLLVLIDGRSIYTPLFSGVFWEAQNLVLDNIERIEVIRGPGSAVWGANAVNGVVNIITRHTRDTQGALISAGGGTVDRGFATVQYGDHAFGDLNYRVYGKAETHTEDETPSGDPGHDGWRDLRSGFRADQDLHQGHLSMQGDAYQLASGDLIGIPLPTPPYSANENITQKNSGGDLLTRWDQTLSHSQDISVLAYYDFNTLTLPYLAGTQEKNFDLEFEHRLHLFERNDISWGLGYRITGDRALSSYLATFEPSSRYGRIASGFVQDEVALIPETLRLTLGGKLEHDSYTGSHFMPNGGLLWDVNASNQAWLSVGRGIRTPSFGERSSSVLYNGVIPPGAMGNPLPILPEHVPDYPLQAEHLLAYELGYRSQFAQTISLDATAFINRYSHVATGGQTLPPVPVIVNGIPSYLLLPIPFSNELSAREAGFELATDWRVLSNWRLQGSYTRLQFHFDDQDFTGTMDSSPRNILSLRSSATVLGTQFDLWLRHVGQRNATASTPEVDAYTTLDTGLSWRLPQNLEFAIVGKDLLERRHSEIVSNFISSEPIAVERSAYLKVTWTY